MSNPEDVAEIVTKLDYLIDKISELERRLVSLEKSMEKVNNPGIIDSGVKVIKAIETPTQNKVDLAKAELIDIYNHDFQQLTRHVIKVSVTEDSLSHHNSQAILLEERRNANYWIIVNKNDDFYLVPKSNLKINTYNYQTVASLFDCQEYQPDAYHKFTLTHPAIVEPTSNGKQWILVQRGVLQFITDAPDTAVVVDNQELDENKRDRIETQHKLAASIPIYQPASQYLENYPQLPAEILLVNDYNQNRNLFTSLYSVIEVRESEESINRVFFINNEPKIQLVKLSPGHYWIVVTENISYLFPKFNIIINRENLDLVQDIFECQNYQDNHSQSFTLIQPGKLSPLFPEDTGSVLTSVDRWILLERGVLRFKF